MIEDISILVSSINFLFRQQPQLLPSIQNPPGIKGFCVHIFLKNNNLNRKIPKISYLSFIFVDHGNMISYIYG